MGVRNVHVNVIYFYLTRLSSFLFLFHPSTIFTCLSKPMYFIYIHTSIPFIYPYRLLFTYLDILEILIFILESLKYHLKLRLA